MYQQRNKFYDDARRKSYVPVNGVRPSSLTIDTSRDLSYDSRLPLSPTSPLLDLDNQILSELDSLVTSQQVLLQSLGVPCFFVTKHPKLLEKQRVVMEILSGAADLENSEGECI